MLIVAGTSLNVYPAAGLIYYFNGKHLVLVNKERVNIREDNVLIFQNDMNKVFKEVMEKGID